MLAVLTVPTIPLNLTVSAVVIALKPVPSIPTVVPVAARLGVT